MVEEWTQRVEEYQQMQSFQQQPFQQPASGELLTQEAITL